MTTLTAGSIFLLAMFESVKGCILPETRPATGCPEGLQKDKALDNP